MTIELSRGINRPRLEYRMGRNILRERGAESSPAKFKEFFGRAGGRFTRYNGARPFVTREDCPSVVKSETYYKGEYYKVVPLPRARARASSLRPRHCKIVVASVHRAGNAPTIRLDTRRQIS